MKLCLGESEQKEMNKNAEQTLQCFTFQKKV